MSLAKRSFLGYVGKQAVMCLLISFFEKVMFCFVQFIFQNQRTTLKNEYFSKVICLIVQHSA